ncbi:MAG TPA: thiamine pyrophosphate-dependent enzyme, partial [Longimicrobiales bacterium]|nr:thiamine pyrophosphate-dependent enzyme [Longimicrobiales bacterium]
MIQASTRAGRLLLGDEAVALGALDAGVSAAYAYPGTPSTEILEHVAREGPRYGVTAHWTANEKTAYEAALGVSMVGRRALVSMKHVGLNVAADPFVSSALVRLRGGLVLAVADDPSMHSSQNEQDSRVLADFARVLCLEPADPQQAYDLTREAFDLSERLRVPVVLRLVTRLCHGRARVVPASPRTQNTPTDGVDGRDWTLLPANARRLWRELLDRQGELLALSEGWPGNVFEPGSGATARPSDPEARAPAPERDGWPADDGLLPLGVVTAGTGRNLYTELARELDPRPPHLHVEVYPLPAEKLRDLASLVERVLVLEEGYPFVERQLRGLLASDREILGRESGALPPAGELTPESVREALGLEPRPFVDLDGPALPPRPPQLCKGCPHRDALTALGRAGDATDPWLVTGDIGCYALGALPPWEALRSCVCMGASIGMARGAADAGHPRVLAVIGDSTFLHSGMTPLLDAVVHDTDMTVLILDNEAVAMTGQQEPLLSSSRIIPVLHGLGVPPDHLHVVETHPARLEELTSALSDAMDHRGLS